MTNPTKPEQAEQGTEVREFRVRYEYIGPGGSWFDTGWKQTTHPDIVNIAKKLTSSSCKNVRIETSTVKRSPWAPVPEEKP